MKQFVGSLGFGAITGYAMSQQQWNQAYITAHKYIFNTSKQDLFNFNLKYKHFSGQDPMTYIIPEEIQKQFLQEDSKDRILLHFDASMANVNQHDYAVKGGMLFTYISTSNGQGHNDIMHGGLAMTLNELMVKELYKNVYYRNPTLSTFEIKFRKPINCYSKVFVVAKEIRDEQGNSRCDLTSYDSSGAQLQEYQAYLASEKSTTKNL